MSVEACPLFIKESQNTKPQNAPKSVKFKVFFYLTSSLFISNFCVPAVVWPSVVSRSREEEEAIEFQDLGESPRSDFSGFLCVQRVQLYIWLLQLQFDVWRQKLKSYLGSCDERRGRRAISVKCPITTADLI